MLSELPRGSVGNYTMPVCMYVTDLQECVPELCLYLLRGTNIVKAHTPKSSHTGERNSFRQYLFPVSSMAAFGTLYLFNYGPQPIAN